MTIVNMEMPKSCHECPFGDVGHNNRWDVCIVDKHLLDYNTKMVDDNCPIKAEIPDNATNGDVIKAMFPNAKSKRNLASDILYFGRSQTMMRYTNEWWDAPYKSEKEDKE